MAPANQRVRPNTSEIAAEVIDGEAILINLVTGMYFSMDGAGAVVWRLVSAGLGVEEIVSRLSAQYQVPRNSVHTDVDRLIAELLEQRLIVLSDDDAGSSEIPIHVEDAETYQPPKLVAYRDMGDLLALDPPAPGFAGIRGTPRDSSGD